MAVNRLTSKDDYGCVKYNGTLTDAINKLADYEDTGLTPAQVWEMMTDWVVYKQAQAEGRMLIRPRR